MSRARSGRKPLGNRGGNRRRGREPRQFDPLKIDQAAYAVGFRPLDDEIGGGSAGREGSCFHATEAKVKHSMARMKRILGVTLAAGALLVLASCANDRGPHPNLPPLGVGTHFTSRNLCSLGVSPEIRLGSVPANVATYRLRVSEVTTLRGPRWQADIPAQGSVIGEGAMDGFDLPCPGDKQQLSYRFEVMALAPDARPLAYGWGFSSALSLPEQIEVEQRRAKRGDTPNVSGAPRRPAFFIQ